MDRYSRPLASQINTYRQSREVLICSERRRAGIDLIDAHPSGTNVVGSPSRLKSPAMISRPSFKVIYLKPVHTARNR